MAPNAGALQVLEAAICSVVKGFCVLSFPGNVRFFFWTFLFGDLSSPVSPESPLAPPARSKGQKVKDAEMLLGDGFWFVLSGGVLSRHQRL